MGSNAGALEPEGIAFYPTFCTLLLSDAGASRMGSNAGALEPEQKGGALEPEQT